MAKITIADFAIFAAVPQHLFRLMLLLPLLLSNVIAQRVTDSGTPLGLAPGAPAGSYALSGFDNINLFSGNLNFRLPLLRVEGRGGAGYTMVLPIEQHWVVEHSFDGAGNDYPFPAYNWWDNLKPGYGPGVLHGRRTAEYVAGCDGPSPQQYTVRRRTRLTFTAPDGTEYELWDQLSGGVPLNGPCWTSTTSRGTVFLASDGSAATFTSDSTIYDPVVHGDSDVIYPSGYLMLRDGTRYRIDNGLVTWMRDRNGNRLSFTYDASSRVTTVTDSLNRQVTIAYDVNDGAPYGVCDRITVKGYGGAPRVSRVSKATLGNSLRSDFRVYGSTCDGSAGVGIRKYSELFPELYGVSGTCFNPTVVAAVWLPNGQHYQFYYNPDGELARVELPTGGAYEYDWARGLTNEGYASGVLAYNEIYRRAVERRIYVDGTTLEGKMTYSRPADSFVTNINVVMEQLNPSLARQAKQQHFFYGNPRPPGIGGALFVDPPWTESRENQTDSFDTNGTTVLRRLAHTWEQGCSPQTPRITATVTTLMDTNQVSKQTFTYDCYNNQTEIYEYDFGSGAPPNYATRHTHVDFLTTNPVNGANYATDNNVHLRSLPSSQIVYTVNSSTGAETWAAQAVYEYDRYDASANHAALINRTNISGLDGAFTTSYQTRGNVTRIDRWLNSGGSPLVSAYAQFDIAGNIVKTIDGQTPTGNVTTFDFNDRYGAPDGDARANAAPPELGAQVSYAFATKVTNPLNHIAYRQLDSYTGNPVDTEDPNSVKFSLSYNDLLDRPTQSLAAVGTTVQRQTLIRYNDTASTNAAGDPPFSATTLSDKDNYQESSSGNGLKATARYDGLGRTWRKAAYEGSSNWAITDTEFDARGRVWRVSNPYRATSLTGASNPPGEWTTNTYDALSRVIAVATPDGATMATAYDGAKVRVTDQAAKQRISETDGLGRLSKVWEVASVGTDSVTFLNVSSNSYLTQYGYDGLDDLTTVTQGAQTRTFVYDSLKRLTAATNPESGLTSYVYDNNGNLLEKTDARTAKTTFAYDALNRVTSKLYSGTTSEGINAANATPPVYFKYDNQAFPAGAPAGFNRGFATGRLVAATYGSSTASTGCYYGYDELGRVVRKTQQTGTINYPITATYNRAGAMLSETYPSNRALNYTYDLAGRADTTTGTLGDGSLRNYATGITYTAAGLLTKEQLGTTTPLYHRWHYNNRLQLFDTRIGTDSSTVNDGNNNASWTMGSQDRGSIQLYHSTNYAIGDGGTNNNGNIWRMDTFVPLASDPWTGWAAAIDYYSHDDLNRLTQIVEQSVGSATQTPFVPLQQTYQYDRYGNRTIDATKTFGGAGNSTPYNYTVRQVPGTIEAEDYDLGGQNVAYNDADTANQGGQYRTSEGVDIEANDGGYTVGYTNGGEWIKYTINVTTTGTYSLTTRLGSALSGATFHLEIDGVNKTGSLTVPNTGSWTVFTTINTPGISLSRGQHVMKLVIEGTGTGKGNFNWFQWALTSAGGTTTPTSAINNLAYAVNATNNRLGVPSGQSGAVEYDSVGNLTRDTWNGVGFARLNYDAENHVKTATDDSGGANYGTYTYDGDGKRVKRVIAGVETWQVYGIGGELLAEYAANTGPSNPQKEYGYRNGQLLMTAVGSTVTWLMQDQLGSTRMELAASGAWNAVTRHDYLPFGEEIGANVGVRGNSGSGYATSSIRQRYGSKERDTETGLDFFGARYFASVQGRFTSADPLLSSGTVYDPQSWNRYSYTLNNPLKYTDPFGLYVYAAGTTDEEKKKFEQGLKDLQKARDSFKKGSAEYNRLGRSLNAYGAKNVDNGVIIAFGATKDGAPAATSVGINAPAGTKVTTADNPTGQDTRVTIDPTRNKSADDYVSSVGHEGSHVADGSELVGALPADLTSSAAQAVLNGSLNLTKYVTETRAYEATSFIAQGRSGGTLTIGSGKHEIWNSGWRETDRATKRSAGIDKVLADPSGFYKVTATNQGDKLIP